MLVTPRAIYIPQKVRSEDQSDLHKSNGMIRNPHEVSSVQIL